MSATPDRLEALGPWRARWLRRASPADAAYLIGLLLLAAAVLGSGRLASRRLSPSGAQSASALLDDLELPRLLPNATLTRDDGREIDLWDLAAAPRTVVTFYAPWCGPCQTELPALAKGTSAHPERLVVVVGADEEPVEVRKKLDDLGLASLHFHVDGTRKLAEGGRVTGLPTSFLIGRMGRVQERIVGYSEFRAQMLIYKTMMGDTVPSSNDGN